jgi:deoxyribonuclease-4
MAVARDILIGFHVSIAGGISLSVKRALDVGCTTMQIFTHSPRMWKLADIPAAEAGAFRSLRQNSGISPVFVHTSYLINVATKDKDLYEKSIASLKAELARADLLGAEYVVTHLGSVSGDGVHGSERRIADALNKVFDGMDTRAMLLIENTAGERGDVGSSYDEIAGIIDLSGLDNLGVAVDTCHSWGAGYDLKHADGLDAAIGEMEKSFGLERLRLIHLNDSKYPLGSRRDRHQDIGRGEMGVEAFRLILNHPKLKGKPFVMETPKSSEEDDKRNMAVARSLIRKTRPGLTVRPRR